MGKIRKLTGDKKTPDKLTRVTKQKKISDYLKTASNTKVKVEPENRNTKTTAVIGKINTNKKYKMFFQIMPKPKMKGATKDPAQGSSAAEPTQGDTTQEPPAGETANETQQGGGQPEPTQGSTRHVPPPGETDHDHLQRNGLRVSPPGESGRVPTPGELAREHLQRPGLRVLQPGEISRTTPEGDSERGTLPKDKAQGTQGRTIPTPGETPPTNQVMDRPRGAGACSEETQDPTPMEGDEGPMLEGIRQRNASKRKRSEPGEGQVTEVLGRLTELYMNGDAGNKIGKYTHTKKNENIRN